jgi:hypothetical protein
MPIYEYELEATKQRYEVIHSIDKAVSTWKDLALLLDVPVGDLGLDSPVKRIIGGRVFVNGNLEDLSKGKVVQKEAKRSLPTCCGGGCGH